MQVDQDSYFEQNYLIIELSKDYFYSRAYFDLKDNAVTDNVSTFVMKSPYDTEISAREEYRTLLKRYDFVLV